MKTAFISGAARRIGAYLAEHLHAQGYQILLHYHQSRQEAQTLCKHLLQKRANSAHLICADLNAPQSSAAIFEEIKKYTDTLDVLIHNASVFSKLDSDWDKMFQVNVKTPYFLSRLAYPLLQKTKGCIINITDIHAERPFRDFTAYVQTKAAFSMQTKALALEFAPTVRVNAIAPGAILWPEQANSLSQALQNEVLGKIPLGQEGGAKSIAIAMDCLIQNHYLTGETIHVDGGRLLK